MAVVVAG